MGCHTVWCPYVLCNDQDVTSSATRSSSAVAPLYLGVSSRMHTGLKASEQGRTYRRKCKTVQYAQTRVNKMPRQRMVMSLT